MEEFNLEKQYKFTAYVNQFRESTEQYSGVKVLIENIYFDNCNIFRDHVWINSSHRFRKIKKGDSISFTAQIYKYISSEGEKYGLTKIRNIKKI